MNAAGADHPSTASEDLVRAYFSASVRKDKATILSILTEDIVLEVPFPISGNNDPTAEDNRTKRGIDAVSATFDRAFRNISTMKFNELVVSPTTDPDVVFVEAFGDGETATGRPYKNRYVFRFDLDDGKIRRVREYYNPVTSAIAFDRPFPGS